MNPKIVVSAVAIILLSLSGCCRLFGVCTSVAVHTSITPTRSFEDALSGRYKSAPGANVLPQSFPQDICID